MVPSTITADCTRDVGRDLNDFLAAVPDGATVDFPAGACYAQSESVLLKGRNNLTIDGKGSTFRSSAPNDNSKLVPNWWLLRSRGITIRNLTAIGNFHDTGSPSPQRGSVTSNAGVSIYGGSDITVTGVTVRDVFGDGVTLGNAAYFDPGPNELPVNVRLSGLDVRNAARHCVSVSHGTRIWVQDGKLDRCFLHGIDAEKDLQSDPLTDLHFLRLTITNYFSIGIVVPTGGLAGTPVDGIEIRGNHFPTLPVAAPCNPPHPPRRLRGPVLLECGDRGQRDPVLESSHSGSTGPERVDREQCHRPSGRDPGERLRAGVRAERRGPRVTQRHRGQQRVNGRPELNAVPTEHPPAPSTSC